jgi:NADH-quinone oxidoreductase subunit E
VCLGACDKAPVIMIGEKTHCNVDHSVIDRIVAPSGSS